MWANTSFHCCAWGVPLRQQSNARIDIALSMLPAAAVFLPLWKCRGKSSRSWWVQGFDVIEKGGSQADGGVDLVLRKGHETFLVQCKHWKAMAAGVSIVRELYGVMAAKGAAGGFVVTSGRFTNDAVAFAKGRNIELIDGVALAKMLRLAACATDLETRPKSCEPMQAPDNATPPECPACGAPMIRRTARQGSHAGSQFFGCSRFPACRGILSNR